jgi:hypothetical protein
VAIPGYKYIQASWQKEIFSVDIFQGAFLGFLLKVLQALHLLALQPTELLASRW